jgi:hypothetical protein
VCGSPFTLLFSSSAGASFLPSSLRLIWPVLTIMQESCLQLFPYFIVPTLLRQLPIFIFNAQLFACVWCLRVGAAAVTPFRRLPW